VRTIEDFSSPNEYDAQSIQVPIENAKIAQQLSDLDNHHKAFASFHCDCPVASLTDTNLAILKRLYPSKFLIMTSTITQPTHPASPILT
jgi:hypothetical protein